MSNYIHGSNWNILIVLDACRYDYFKKINWLSGKLEKITVSSSMSIQWLKTYYPDKYPYTYISANPFCNNNIKFQGFLGSEHFKEVVDVWKFGWNEEYKTVLPETVTNTALHYLDRDKLIIHYMQPHFPSIGSIRIYPEAWKPNPLDTHILDFNYKSISNNILRKAYEENLYIVLKEVEKLLSHVDNDKKVVITADHGELLGEDGLYSHPNVKHPLLNTVAWFEVEL